MITVVIGIYSLCLFVYGTDHIEIELPVQHIVYSIEQCDGIDHIIIPDGHTLDIPGQPDMPCITFSYLLPCNTRVTDITITQQKWEKLPGTYVLEPVRISPPIDQPGRSSEEIKVPYSEQRVYPDSPVYSFSPGNVRGYSVVQIAIIPFQYETGTRMLSLLRGLKITCTLKETAPVITTCKQTSYSDRMMRSYVSSFVENPEVLKSIDYTPDHILDDTPGYDVGDGLPSPLGPPVDYCIITSDNMRIAYEEYARYIALLGLNTAVRTINWIRQHYGGLDDTERIRNFLKDAVVNWGVLFVLLGGDTQIIPTRWVYMEPLYERWPVHIVTDLYYADLDGTWNYDGDVRFGEVSDSLDLYPDVFVSRIPTTSTSQVTRYLEKLVAYHFNEHPLACTRALFITSDLEVNNDALNIARRLADHLPAGFDTVFCNERPLGEVLDSVESGFGFIAGIGHGDINNLRVRNSPRESIYNFNFDSLTNINGCSFMMAITCYTNTIQADCLSEHWLLVPQGGGIGYVGPTSSSEAYLHEEFMTAFIDSMFNVQPIGMAFIRSKIPFVAQSQWDNWYRLYQFSLVMLGDPFLTIWDNVPLVYDTFEVSPETLHCGIDTLFIRCMALDTCTLVLLKDGELYQRDTMVYGTIETEVFTESPGYVYYSVRSHGYKPVIGSLYVQAPEPQLHVQSYTIIDSSGNNNSVLNPGERIDLFITLHNSGTYAASSVNMQLVCHDSMLSMLCDTTSYSVINAGAYEQNNTPLCFVVHDTVPDSHAFTFETIISYHGVHKDEWFTAYDSFQITCAAPLLFHFTQTPLFSHRIDSDTIDIIPYIGNRGHQNADSVYAMILSMNDSIQIIDSVVQFPNIPAGKVIAPGDDRFRLYIPDTSMAIQYGYDVYLGNSIQISTLITIDSPDTVTGLRAYPQAHGITLLWEQAANAQGYRVYRSTDLNGEYVCITPQLIHSSIFTDNTVNQQVVYYYRIVTVDSSMNHSPMSTPCMGMTNSRPMQGWPQPVFDYLFSSPSVTELDPFYPGLEIVVCGKNGHVYAWHCDGTPLTEHGVLFDISPAEVWTSPAVGDVTNNGNNEIVFGVRRSTDNLYLLSNNGICLPGWPITVPGSLIGSPVLADLDGDNDLEILVWTLQADVYVYHHDGQGYFPSNGLLKDLPGIALGSIAVGDIDQDNDPEIVCAGGSNGDSLYVWDHTGNNVDPFPVFIQSQGLPYSVVLGDIIGGSEPEILFYADSVEGVYAVNTQGTVLWMTPLGSLADIEGSPVIGDVTGDGRGEIICGYQTGLTILDSTGTHLNGFPDTTHDAKLPVIAEICTQGRCDVIVGSADWHVYGYTHQAQWAPGFPMILNNRIESSPAVYDLDLDGDMELLVGGNGLWFNVYDLTSHAWEWPLFRYDQYNSGMYKSGNLYGIDHILHAPKPACFSIIALPSLFSSQLTICIEDLPFSRGGSKIYAITVYDIAGRAVRHFKNSLPAYCTSLSITWYGDDDLGRILPCGVYFISVSHKQDHATKKVVKIE